MDDINSIVMFEGAKPEVETPAQATVESKAEPTGDKAAPPADKQERDEKGQFKGKDEKAETQEKPEHKAEDGRMSALLSERRQRQSLQTELEQARARIAQLEQGGEKKDDFWADPEKAIQAQVQKQLTPIRERAWNASMKAAAKEHKDFEAVAEEFAKLLDADPSLHSRWINSEDPGEFIYEMGSNTPAHRQKQAEQWKTESAAKDAEIVSLKSRIAELENTRKAIDEVPESLNRQPSGASPSRRDDDTDIRKIVRFQN